MIVRTKRFQWKNDLMDYLLGSSTILLLLSTIIVASGPHPDRSIVIGAGIMTIVCGLSLFLKNTEYSEYKSPFVVTFDGKEVRSSHPKRSYGSVLISQIVEVGVLTTDEGPIAPDVWIMLLDDDGLTCTFPSDAEGSKPVIDLLLTFEGFDHRTFIEAIGSTSNAKFVVWQKKPAVG